MRICIQEPCAIWGEQNLTLGEHVHIGRHTEIMAEGGIRIGNNVVISYHCVLWSIDHRYEGDGLPYDKARLRRPIVIGDNVWIGRNSIVRGGVTIGEGAVVAMGSVVTRDVPPLGVVGGNPARLLKFRDAERYVENKAKNNILWRPGESCGACQAPDYYLMDPEIRPAPPLLLGWWQRLETLIRYTRWRWFGGRDSGRISFRS